MRESSIYAGWHMAGSPRRKRRRPPHPVPHFRTRPQSCDPDVITSQTILPLFVFTARPAPHAHPIPRQIWANIPTWNPATGLNTAVLTYSRPGASWRCAWICHRRHCLRVTRSQIAGRSLQKSSPRYITIHPSPSFFLPLQPLSSPHVPCSS